MDLLDIFVKSSNESLTTPFDSDELDNNLYSIVQSQEDGQPTWCLPSPQHTPASTEEVDGSIIYFDTPLWHGISLSININRL